MIEWQIVILLVTAQSWNRPTNLGWLLNRQQKIRKKTTNITNEIVFTAASLYCQLCEKKHFSLSNILSKKTDTQRVEVHDAT